METMRAPQGETLELRQVLSAPPERVFRAWTEPEQLKAWWGPEGMALPEAELDLRVGGRYRFTMQGTEMTVHVYGEYRHIEPPHRLVFTWNWEEDDIGETLVTVEFRPHGDGTELVLTHEGLPTTQQRDNHEQGWSSSFVCLRDALAQ